MSDTTGHERQQVIAGLRDLARFLEDHPDVKVFPYIGMVVPFQDREEFAVTALALGRAEKKHDSHYFSLERFFGPYVRYEAFIACEKVCTRLVVGTRDVVEQVIPAHTEEIVEWECHESLFDKKGSLGDEPHA